MDKKWTEGKEEKKARAKNPAVGMDVCLLFLLCCIGRCLCDGPITPPGESYRVCVCECVTVGDEVQQ
jgi:hypothetical protein